MPQSNERSTGVAVKLTKNLGNYESASFEAWENMPLDDDEDAAETRDVLFDNLKEEIREQVRKLK